MDAFLTLAWTPFLAIFGWLINRMTSRLDSLEKQKADAGSIDRMLTEIHELEKRQDRLMHTTVPRPEFKGDITSLHMRINELSNLKEDKIKDIRVINSTHKAKGK
tara:strand:+ start:222 stop:536 length:315 start_codon:yes stop_codon:yes gene_type:complete